MKKFTNVFTESNIIPTSKLQKSVTNDVQPGNTYPGNNGVTNHYTPIENILTNVRNLFCTRAGVVAAIAEDGVSIKLHSTKFINKKEIERVLYEPFNTSAFNNDMGIATYIQSQGLDKMTIVNLGQYNVVYFSPSDMPQQSSVPTPTQEIVGQEIECESVIIPEEMHQYNIFEAEIDTINEATDDDEEIQETTRKQIIEIIKSKDKVKAAKQLAVLIGNNIELPQDYYFAGVNMQNNEQAIALRWRYLKKRPHNKTTEVKRSLIYFFDTDKDGIWVGDFDKDAMFHLPKEVDDLIHNILDLVGAKETSDPCVWSLADAEDEIKKDDEKKDDEKKDDEKKNDEKKDDEKKSDDKQDDNEDDKSRGDNSDSLL